MLIPSQPGDLDSLLARHRRGRGARPRLPRRSGARSDPFRLHRVAAALCRAAAPAAGGRDPDGHRQPDRADRRRFARRHRRAARHLLGACASATCSACRSARTRAAPSRSTTRRAGSCSPRARTAACRAATATRCSALHDRKPFPVTPGGDRRASPREVRDPNFRIEVAEDGIHVYNRDGHHVADRCAVALSRSSASRADGAHAFYLGAELDEGGDRLPARQALRAGRAARLGRRRRPAGGGPDAARRGRPHAARQAGRLSHADDPRDDRHDGGRATARCTSRRSA